MRLEVEVDKRLGDFRLQAGFAVSGARIGLFGPSGSGKSTLMHLLAGLLRVDRGRIAIDGEVLCDSAAGIHLPPEQRRIGVVFQHAHLFPHLSVERNLLYGYRRLPQARRRIAPAALIEVLGLGGLLGRDVTSLSGGERQRVALGRSILACPRLILLDEPLTGLDEKLKYQIIPYLTQVFAEFEIPLLLISHSLNEMRLLSETVLEIAGGAVLGQTSAEELARRAMGSSRIGYINLLELSQPREHDGLYSYLWGDQQIVLSAGSEAPGGMFELSSKDITLFKRHPEASSARNMLNCRVAKLFGAGNRIGVELDCGGRTLVSQVVGEAAIDLGLQPGSEVVAVIKASAFRRLY